MGLLTSAKVLPAKTTTAAAKSKKLEVAMTDLELYAQLDALQKAVETMKKTLGAEINGIALDKFVELGQNGVKPESFVGVDGNATASVELRKRSTASVLTDDEVVELNKLSIPVERVVKTSKMFGINTKYTEDMDMLTKVEKALEGVVPDDLFVLQEEVAVNVVSDETLNVAFSKKASKEVIRMLTVSALKPKLAKTDMAEILLAVKPFLVEESDAEAATKALAK